LKGLWRGYGSRGKGVGRQCGHLYWKMYFVTEFSEERGGGVGGRRVREGFPARG